MDNADTDSQHGDHLSPDELPFVAPSHELPTFAALDWMAAGWRDFKRTPIPSLTYGGLLVLASYLLTFASWKLGGAVLLLSLLSGLVFIAPVLALGLYSVSCQIEEGQQPRLLYCVREGRRHLGNELLFSLVLLVIFLLWVRAGSAIHIFFPMESNTQLADFLVFYGVGSAIGAVFAGLVFCASAFSLPMMMDRNADAITAVLTSVSAVRKNKIPMLIWAIVIATSVVLSFLTAYLLMAVLMPVLGYATWHGYRQTIDASQWPENRKLSDSYPVDQQTETDND